MKNLEGIIDLNESNAKPNRKKRPLWFRGLRTMAICYVLICFTMMLLETTLIFPAPGPDRGNWNPEIEFEEIEIVSSDKTKLVAWILPKKDAKQHIIYFHGNGTNIAQMAPKLDLMRKQFDATVMAVDYRGYGKSEGSPYERGILNDGLAAIDAFAKREKIKTDQVCIVARSLGGAVAVHVASERKVKCLILESTFDSLVSVAAGHYPWLPVRILMRNRFKSFRWAGKVECPVLQFHGTADRTVPIQRGQKLHESFAGKDKTWVEIEKGRHNDRSTRKYYVESAKFLERLSNRK